MRDNVDLLQDWRSEESASEYTGEPIGSSRAADVPTAVNPSQRAPQPAAPVFDNAAACHQGGDDEPFWHARQPVYEASRSAILGRQLVMTPWMLLDRLRECQERTDALRQEACEKNWGAERRQGRTVNPLTERLDRLSDDLAHTLYILWRGGLWLDARDGLIETRTDADGTPHQVACAPFTDGKPHGRPLPPDAPAWLCDLLGAGAQTR